MLWFEVCLYSGRGGTRFGAWFEYIVRQRNGDDSNDSDDEVGEKLSLCAVRKVAVVEGGGAEIPVHRMNSRYHSL